MNRTGAKMRAEQVCVVLAGAAGLMLLWRWWAGLGALDPFHTLLGGVAVACWYGGRGRLGAALLVLALLGSQWAHFLIQMPGTADALRAAPGWVRMEGTIRAKGENGNNAARAKGENGNNAARAKGGNGNNATDAESEPPQPASGTEGGPAGAGEVWLVLGEVDVWSGTEHRTLAELTVRFDGKSAWPFPHRQRVRLGGFPALVHGPGWRHTGLDVRLEAMQWHPRASSTLAWWGEGLRLRLRDRAAYYLNREALAVYLPLVLGHREERGPESREVTQAFRVVGVAHLFAISGLHIGLIYLLFLGLLRWPAAALSMWATGRGWLPRPLWHLLATPAGARWLAVAACWGYIALIGFPVPAVRAALMGTLLVWSMRRGVRTGPMHILLLAALALLLAQPSMVYDLSFRLSFLALFFLLLGLGGHGPVRQRAGRDDGPGFVMRLLRGAGMNLWVTLVITLGLWPLSALVFGRVPLMVFVGNLLLVPLMGVLVLPLGLLALLVSLWHLGRQPQGGVEAGVFALLEWTLDAWLWVVRLLEQWAGALLVETGGMEAGWTALYYLLLVGALWGTPYVRVRLIGRQSP